jgi:hypothetical protein
MASYFSNMPTSGLYRLASSRAHSAAGSPSGAASTGPAKSASDKVLAGTKKRIAAATSLGASTLNSARLASKSKLSSSSSRPAPSSSEPASDAAPISSRRDSITLARDRRRASSDAGVETVEEQHHYYDDGEYFEEEEEKSAQEYASKLSAARAVKSESKSVVSAISSTAQDKALQTQPQTPQTPQTQQALQQQAQQVQQQAQQQQPIVRGILATAKSSQTRRWNGGKRRVVFNKTATLHYLPAHELASARLARQGSWEAAPEHDELWDGDLQDFRRVELTQSQLDRQLGGRGGYDNYGGSQLSYTYPPARNAPSSASKSASYEYASGAGAGDLDELDSYMDGLSLAPRGSVPTTKPLSLQPQAASSCYVCLATIDWPVKQVSAFVRDHVSGGEFLCSSFEHNYVDGQMFLQMEERDLRNIGIKRRADRQAILDAKQELLRGLLSRQTCTCAKTSSTQSVLDKHSRFLQSTQSFLNTL